MSQLPDRCLTQSVSDTKVNLYQLLLYSTWVALPIDGCHKGLILHHRLKPLHSCNSGDKCNCQNNKSFFAVISLSCTEIRKRRLHHHHHPPLVQSNQVTKEGLVVSKTYHVKMGRSKTKFSQVCPLYMLTILSASSHTLSAAH